MKNDTDASLEQQHRRLDAEIKKASQRPWMCPTEFRALKRRKLELKERIVGMRKETEGIGVAVAAAA